MEQLAKGISSKLSTSAFSPAACWVNRAWARFTFSANFAANSSAGLVPNGFAIRKSRTFTNVITLDISLASIPRNSRVEIAGRDGRSRNLHGTAPHLPTTPIRSGGH